MSAEKQEHVAPLGGILLIFLGTVFLLQTLDILPWGLWWYLWRLWPVVLVIVGLGILLRHKNIWLVSLLLLAILFGSLGIAYWQYNAHPESSPGFQQAMGNLSEAQVKIDYAVGSLRVGSLPVGSASLVETGPDGSRTARNTAATFHQQGSQGFLFLSNAGIGRPVWSRTDESWQVSLTREIPLTMTVKSDLSNGALDLARLKVAQLDINVGLSDFDVQMPSPSGSVSASIKSDLARMEVTIPAGVAVRIRVTSSLSSVTVNETRFPRRGDDYVSPGYETAGNRLDLQVNCSLGSISVR